MSDCNAVKDKADNYSTKKLLAFGGTVPCHGTTTSNQRVTKGKQPEKQTGIYPGHSTRKCRGVVIV